MTQEPSATKPPAKAAQPARPPEDEVEESLTGQKSLEAHRQDLIKELLRKNEATIKAFDEELAEARLQRRPPCQAQPSQTAGRKEDQLIYRPTFSAMAHNRTRCSIDPSM
jgi:hypothetical protein